MYACKYNLWVNKKMLMEQNVLLKKRPVLPLFKCQNVYNNVPSARHQKWDFLERSLIFNIDITYWLIRNILISANLYMGTFAHISSDWLVLVLSYWLNWLKDCWNSVWFSMFITVPNPEPPASPLHQSEEFDSLFDCVSEEPVDGAQPLLSDNDLAIFDPCAKEGLYHP